MPGTTVRAAPSYPERRFSSTTKDALLWPGLLDHGTILRLAFVLGFVFSIGTFLLVYVILWIIMPSESEHRADVINGP